MKNPNRLPIAKEVESKNDPLEFVSSKELVEMRPRKLADYLTSLYKSDQLESFLYEVADDPSVRAHLSYWEKWVTESKRKLVDRIVLEKQEIYGEKSSELPLALEEKFSQEELEKVIAPNIRVIQLTYGCSKKCPFCALDAVPGERDHLPYAQLANLFQQYGKQLGESRPFLYWASDPVDYAGKEGLEDRTYEDIHQLALEYAGYDPHITSKEVDDPKWIEFLKNGGTGEGGRRISMYGENIEKQKEASDKLKGGDISVRLLGIALDQEKGPDHFTGVGVSYDKFGKYKPEDLIAGIGCRDGLLLTPRGLYSLVQLPVSEKYPQGQIVKPFESLNDDDISVGDSLEDILGHKVPIYKGNPSDKTWASKKAQHHNQGAFPKKVYVYGKSKGFLVTIDEEGIILVNEEMTLEQRQAELFYQERDEYIKRVLKEPTWKFLKPDSVIDLSLPFESGVKPQEIKLLFVTSAKFSPRLVAAMVTKMRNPYLKVYVAEMEDGKLTSVPLKDSDDLSEIEGINIPEQGKVISGSSKVLNMLEKKE